VHFETGGFDTAYGAISEETDTGHRWAFGTGFTDPLAGVDTTMPGGADRADLEAYCLMLGDDALIMSHRLQEWLARAPELEEETALANIALDLLGQARLLLSRAGTCAPSTRSEDDYAFGRGEREFRNVRLAEIPDTDFAGLIARLVVFSTWRLELLLRLRSSRDPVLAAVAGQGVNELTYHRDYAAQWTVRLGDGTGYSRERMQAGLRAVAPYVPELFEPTAIEQKLTGAGVAADPSELRPEYDAVMAQVLAAAELDWPEVPALAGVAVGYGGSPPRAGTAAGGYGGSPRRAGTAAGGYGGSPPRAGTAGQSGRDGIHTEFMGYLLAEMQSVARAMPGATW
jgi:ring-1,2-phenylacetyl-CoA epoxidase subunit PaaC